MRIQDTEERAQDMLVRDRQWFEKVYRHWICSLFSVSQHFHHLYLSSTKDHFRVKIILLGSEGCNNMNENMLDKTGNMLG